MTVKSYDGYDEILDEIKARVDKVSASFDRFGMGDLATGLADDTAKYKDLNITKFNIRDMNRAITWEIESLRTEIDNIIEGRFAMMGEELESEES